MSHYQEVLSQVKSLALPEKLRLLEELKNIAIPIEVEGDDEVIPIEEIVESEAAWQAYLEGSDPGISSKALKLKLFGEKLD